MDISRPAQYLDLAS